MLQILQLRKDLPHSTERTDWSQIKYESGEALEQIAQRRCGCPTPGSDHGQAGWSFEQFSLEKGVPADGGSVKLNDLKVSSDQPVLFPF